jgi:hypothetical protein
MRRSECRRRRMFVRSDMNKLLAMPSAPARDGFVRRERRGTILVADCQEPRSDAISVMRCSAEAVPDAAGWPRNCRSRIALHCGWLRCRLRKAAVNGRIRANC